MTDDPIQRLAQMAADDLREIAEDFADAVGRNPTSHELCELLAYGLQSSRTKLLDDVESSSIATLRPRLADGAAEPHDSAVDELDDGPFSNANALVTMLAQAYRGETGTLPTLDELCELIAEALRRSRDVLSDVDAGDIAGVEADRRSNAGASTDGAESRPGDIVAIPAPGGGHFTAVVVARNQLGTAYGLFRGVRDEEPVSASSPPEVVRHPIYSGDELVKDGTWPVVGHDEGLLELFPREPEVFYGEPLMPDIEPDTGPHGSAETPAGERRDLDEEEADEAGLTDGSYREFHPAETVADYIADRHGEGR